MWFSDVKAFLSPSLLSLPPSLSRSKIKKKERKSGKEVRGKENKDAEEEDERRKEREGGSLGKV